MDKRVLLFTGKGGVGKTTCAAATALQAADRGYRTLVMSSDPAHSLSDAFHQPIGPEPVEIYPRLFAQEVDLYYSMKKYWGNIRDLLLMVFKWQGVHDFAAEELAAIPGMGEASALLWLDLFYHSDAYDLIIVDSAPTGETLTFLTLPQVTEWWLTKAFPFQSLIFQTVGFGVRKTTGIPLDKGYKELKDLFEKLRTIHRVLSDARISSVRLVLNPERMVIQEAKRAFTYLQLYGYGVDAVIVNRIFPGELQESSQWARYLQAQEQYLKEIENSFSPLPIFKVPHLREEVFGIDLLKKVGQEIYGDTNPAQVFYNQPTYRIVKNKNHFELRINLPFVTEKDLEVHQFGEELVIQIQNQRRNYFLPRFLEYYRINHYRLRDHQLCIRFVERRKDRQ